MKEVIKGIVVEAEEAARIWAAVACARTRFPEYFAEASDSEVLDELIRLAIKEEQGVPTA